MTRKREIAANIFFIFIYLFKKADFSLCPAIKIDQYFYFMNSKNCRGQGHCKIFLYKR